MAQNMTLSGGNAAQNQYMNYYNQIRTQLSNNGGFTPVQAQVIEAPEKMVAQQIAQPEAIQAAQMDLENRTYGDYADEAASYLSKYLDNSIAARRRQTANERAAADVDAYSRGMGGSTWLSDAKNRMAMNEAADIMAAQNEFLGQVGQQAYNSMEAQRARNFNASQFNANALNDIAQFNANLQNAINQYNANALMNADEFNINNALRVALQNAEYAQQADMYNSQAQSEWEQYLQQLAWNWAGQMYNTNPVVTGGGGGGRSSGGGGVQTNTGNANAGSVVPQKAVIPKVVNSDDWRNYTGNAPASRNYNTRVNMTK